jgi:hypothetical protein
VKTTLRSWIGRSRSWTARGAAIFLVAFWASLFVVHGLLSRALWERDAGVEICLDGSDVLQMFGEDDVDGTRIFLERLAEAGVSSVGVYWDPGYRLRERLEEWAPRLPDGLAVTLRPEAAPFTDWQSRWDRTSRPWSKGPAVRGVLFTGASVLGYPDLSPVASWISTNAFYLPWMEFSRQRGLAELARRFPHRLIRGHGLTEEEIAKSNPRVVLARFRRAVRERGVRFLYVRLFPGLSSRANAAFVVDLATALRADGFRTEAAQPRSGAWPRTLAPLPTGVRQALALLLAIGGPWLGFFLAVRRWSPEEAPLRLMGVTLLTALVLGALLATPDFLMGVAVFRGVKVALVVPLLAGLFLLFQAKEIRHFLHEPITVGRLGFGLIALGVLGVYVVRSGNDFLSASGIELNVRGALESLFGVRPRFKEFLIGHPLLLVGFYLKARGGGFRLPEGAGPAAQTLHFVFHDHRPFLLAGLIGQLSVINTFCHAHTPLSVSFLRVYHGLWIGALLGGTLIHLLRWAERRWQNLP